MLNLIALITVVTGIIGVVIFILSSLLRIFFMIKDGEAVNGVRDYRLEKVATYWGLGLMLWSILILMVTQLFA